MKDLSIALVMLVLGLFTWRYSYVIWKRRITPALSTWIIFLAGTALSFTTYVIAANYDLRSGILNTMDVVAVVVILLMVIIRGDRSVRFKPFEKRYLVVVGAIIAYGLLSGDAWGSNIFSQILISIGYFPTLQNMMVEKKNTESFTAWACALLSGLISLYPATVGGNTLAILYSVRTIVFVGSVLLVMAYYERRLTRSRSMTTLS